MGPPAHLLTAALLAVCPRCVLPLSLWAVAAAAAAAAVEQSYLQAFQEDAMGREELKV